MHNPSGNVKILRNGEARTSTHAGWWEYRDILDKRRPFKTRGALSGVYGGVWRFGELPYEHREAVKAARYTVYSYSTPIAWENMDGTWFMPDVKYSRTTTRHQNTIRTALTNISDREWSTDWRAIRAGA